MDKISNQQISHLTKVAASTLRALSEENVELKVEAQDLRTKLASFERKDRAEKIATKMEEKGINPELSFQDKVAFATKRDNLDALEEAVGLVAPQTKIASIHDDSVQVEMDPEYAGNRAAETFASALATLE